MLKTLDVLIGFTLVMLIMSMAVTVLTQLITSSLNLRGVALKKGIGSLLRLLDRTIDLNNAKQISDALLRDPLIGGAGFGEKRRLATAVHREELTKLLLEFAATETKVNPLPASGNRPPANQPAAPPAANQPNVTPDIFAAVRGSLAGNGVTNPNQLLLDIRKTALELEKSNPQMANNERVNAAILHHAGETDFVAKLNAWFDQTMDRVSERFTMHTRIWTLVAAIGIAVVLQLDAVTIINRLSVDDNLRKDLVTMAIRNYSEPQAATKATAPGGPAGEAGANAAATGGQPGRAPGDADKRPPGAAPANAGDTERGGLKQPDTIAALKKQGLDDLLKTNLIEVPTSPGAWLVNWSAAGPGSRLLRDAPEHYLTIDRYPPEERGLDWRDR
jgi:hypothetical protein